LKRIQFAALIFTTLLLISTLDLADAAKKRKNNRNDDEDQRPKTDALDKANELDEKRVVSPVESKSSSSSEEEKEKDKAKEETGKEVEAISADKQLRKRREQELRRNLELNEGDQTSNKGELISRITTHKHKGGPDHGIVQVETAENHGHRHNHGHQHSRLRRENELKRQLEINEGEGDRRSPVARGQDPTSNRGELKVGTEQHGHRHNHGYQHFQHFHPRDTQVHQILKRSAEHDPHDEKIDGEVKAPDEIREIVAKEMVRQGLMDRQDPKVGMGSHGRGRVLPLPNSDHHKFPNVPDEQF
jgi:hypothetical protein